MYPDKCNFVWTMRRNVQKMVLMYWKMPLDIDENLSIRNGIYGSNIIMFVVFLEIDTCNIFIIVYFYL